MKRVLLAALLIAGCGGDDASTPQEVCDVPGDGPGFDLDGPMCLHLSSYHLFDDIGARDPADELFPYQLNTPLFTDYAAKDRFLYVPDGQTFAWSDVESFEQF